MTGWKPGHTTISTLVQSGHLERISGDAANGDYLIEQARRRLAGARAANAADHIGAFELAYDSARQAMTALLAQQGLRPRVEGGHIAVADAVTAQFGQGFRAFNRMRRIRNQLEYPRSPADLELEQADTQQALTDAASIISAVEQLLPELGIWQP
ncbi:hypothetical protein HZU40_00185 (plasmid) [Mycolicibacterium fluoranthenivorans]|uniref:HEPN domain-containing protein n=1 Tax=Mycolicibacterium fluoranthenivorans TaxID=258505 RepID=A0A7G8P6F7_9MYCO|nr:hypothetical protein [Mycolicibacterium fluoranthenivorans]QNJ89923.1 hypothetical protein HZU40_00185 [Mycolicibacterium fluoranthenivorans]